MFPGKEEVRISEGTFREVQVEVNKIQEQLTSPLPAPAALVSRKELSPLVKSGGDSQHETKWLQEVRKESLVTNPLILPEGKPERFC